VLFPSILVNVPLAVDIHNLANKLHLLESQIVDNMLFNKDKTLLFKELLEKTFPGDDIDTDNDYTYYITPPTLQDERCFIFAVCSNDKVRILACKLEYLETLSEYCLNDIHVEETTVSLSELLNVSEYLSQYINNKLTFKIIGYEIR